MNITRPLFTAALLALAACSRAPAPSDGSPPSLAPLTFGTSSPDAAGLAKHSSGVYTVGYTFGDLHGANKGGIDAFIRKYHATGDIHWGKQFGTPTRDQAEGVTSDENDNAYVVGMTEGSLAGTRDRSDVFLRKYTPSGRVAWTRQFGTPGENMVGDVAAYGNAVYVVGYTNGKLAGKIGGVDAFIRKYTSDGRVVWTRQFGASWDDLGRDVAVDGSGNAYVVGTTSGMFIRKYTTPSGSVAWTRQLAYRRLDDARAVAVSGSSVYLVGAFVDPNPAY